MITCSWKKTVGIDCPGCGFQRSFWDLLQGEFYDSIMLFPATIPLIATIILLLLHLKFKFRHGAYSLVVFFSLSVFLILFNFFIKLL